MKIIILLLLVSANAFGQLGPNELYPVMMEPAGTPPFFDLGMLQRLNENPKFVRIDSTKGAVTFLKRGELVSYYTQAVKIDSVYSQTRREDRGQCDMGNGTMCLVAHFAIKTTEMRKLVAIITKFGKRIDLSKNYTFIPESQMQE